MHYQRLLAEPIRARHAHILLDTHQETLQWKVTFQDDLANMRTAIPAVALASDALLVPRYVSRMVQPPAVVQCVLHSWPRITVTVHSIMLVLP